MNGAHLLCTGRFSRPSSEAAWQPGRWQRHRNPPPRTSQATLVVQDSGREGAPGSCPPGHECQPYNVRKGAGKSHCFCSHHTKGKERRKTAECIPAAERKQSHSGHGDPAFRAAHLHRQVPQRLPLWRPHRLRCTPPPTAAQLVSDF